MDPYFHLPLPPRSWLWQKLTGRISRTALGRVISNGYDRFTDLRLYLRRNPMPENTNFPLLRCWKTVAPAGLPILVLKAPTTKPRGEEFDYVQYLVEQAGSNSRVVVEGGRRRGSYILKPRGPSRSSRAYRRVAEPYFPSVRIRSLHS